MFAMNEYVPRLIGSQNNRQKDSDKDCDLNEEARPRSCNLKQSHFTNFSYGKYKACWI